MDAGDDSVNRTVDSTRARACHIVDRGIHRRGSCEWRVLDVTLASGVRKDLSGEENGNDDTDGSGDGRDGGDESDGGDGGDKNDGGDGQKNRTSFKHSGVDGGRDVSRGSDRDCDFDVVDVKNLTEEAFHRGWFVPRRPLLIRGGAMHMPASTTWKPPYSNLRKLLGRMPVRVSPIPYGSNFGWPFRDVTFADYLDLMAKDSAAPSELGGHGRTPEDAEDADGADDADDVTDFRKGGGAVLSNTAVDTDGTQHSHRAATTSNTASHTASHTASNTTSDAIPVRAADLPSMLPPFYVFHSVPVGELRQAGAGSVYTHDLGRFRFPFMDPTFYVMDKNGIQVAVGRNGTGAPFHWHTDAMNVLFQGRKVWFMRPQVDLDAPFDRWPISVINRRRPGGRRREQSTEAAAAAAAGGSSEDLKSSVIFRCVQEAGDAVYIPAFWGHGTINDGNCAGVAREFRARTKRWQES